VVRERGGDHVQGLFRAERAKVIDRKVDEHVSPIFSREWRETGRHGAGCGILPREKHGINELPTAVVVHFGKVGPATDIAGGNQGAAGATGVG
jgi:hypothetical protein